jgi:hypothetical protein
MIRKRKKSINNWRYSFAKSLEKFNMRWEGPYRTIEQKGNVNFKLVDINTGKTNVTHAD